MIKLSDYVMQYLSEIGIKNVFMLSGGGCMHLVESLGSNPNLHYVCNLHEQAAAIGAEAYSQYTNNIGAALVTTGPGGTNAITGVTSAWIDSIPIIIISGQVKTMDLIKNEGARQKGYQEIDIVSLVKPITKYAITVMKPETIKYHLQKAFYLAKHGRPGPVWIDIPLDVQGAMLNESTLKGFVPPQEKKIKIISKKMKKVISLINQAERPVILAGNGIRLANAKDKFLELIKILNVPVLTTWKAIDFLPEDHPLYFGRPGIIGQRAANFVQQNSDLIITIGARLDYGQVAFNYENFARAAKKVVVDIDASEIHKVDTKIDVKITVDAKVFIEHLLGQSKKIHKHDTSKWINYCKNLKKKYPLVHSEYKSKSKFVNTYVLVDTLSSLSTKDDIIVPGSSGSCSEVTLQVFRVKEGQRIFNSPGLGSMGFGLPSSIGACIASDKKRTICLIGDGGLQHNIQELELLKRYNLPIKLFILNNNGYGSVRTMQTSHFKGHLVACDPSSGLTLPDTIKVAQSYGLKAERLESHLEIEKKIKDILDYNGPVVCDVIIDPEIYIAPRVATVVKPDGKIISKPMEDLWPYLDKEEFKANMIIKPLEE